MTRTPALLVAWLALAMGLVAALLHERSRARDLGGGPTQVAGRTERCLACHSAPEDDPGGAHTAAALGCSPCHLGDPGSRDKARAHAGMEPEPGALDSAGRTCGRAGCHASEAERVARSPMATARGIVAVNRRVFGETRHAEASNTIEDVLADPKPSPADTHLRKLCGGCHLGARRDNRDDALSHGRHLGTGCSACHAERRPSRGPDAARLPHVPIDARVPDSRCAGCHSRSARISLSYAGLAETSAHSAQTCADPAPLPDGRPACRVQADVHQRGGMACIDCHLHTELMGDGHVRARASQGVEITCEACHGGTSVAARRTWGDVLDDVTRRWLATRGEVRDDVEAVRLGARGTPVWNLRPDGGDNAGWSLTGKLDGRARVARQTPVDRNHTLRGHERLTCAACHSAWIPTCASCHTRFDPSGAQWDFGAGRVTPGRWIEDETPGLGMGFAPPALAVVAGTRIAPAGPGMILSIEARAASGPSGSRRLFASWDPHTTQKTARTCVQCHASPEALGLGAGRLDVTRARTTFTPARPVPRVDALDEGGWVALFPRAPGTSTRDEVRSLDAEEQRRVLGVAPCLACHAAASDGIYVDFKRSLARVDAREAPRCRIDAAPPSRP